MPRNTRAPRDATEHPTQKPAHPLYETEDERARKTYRVSPSALRWKLVSLGSPAAVGGGVWIANDVSTLLIGFHADAKCNALRRCGRIPRQARGEYRLLMLQSVRSACLSLGYRFLTVVVMPIEVNYTTSLFFFAINLCFFFGFLRISRVRRGFLITMINYNSNFRFLQEKSSLSYFLCAIWADVAHIKVLTDLDFGSALAAIDIKNLKDLKRQFTTAKNPLEPQMS